MAKQPGFKEKEQLVELLRKRSRRVRDQVQAAEGKLRFHIETQLKREFGLQDILKERDTALRNLQEIERNVATTFGWSYVSEAGKEMLSDLRPSQYRRRGDEPKTPFQSEVETRMLEQNGAITKLENSLDEIEEKIWLQGYDETVQKLFESARSNADTILEDVQSKLPSPSAPTKRLKTARARVKKATKTKKKS